MGGEGRTAPPSPGGDADLGNAGRRDPRRDFSPAAVAALPEALRLPVQEVFVNSLHIVFLVAAVIGVLAFALALFVEEKPLRSAPGRNADNAEPAAAHI